MAEPTIAVAATPQVGPADRPGYVLVSLPELGTQVRVPASLAAKQEPNRVTSEDGTTSLSLQLLAEDTALKNLLLQLSRSRDVTYQRKSDNWVVLSGHAGSDIFYDKVIVSGARRLAMSVQYPEAVRTLYDGELAAIASSFRAMKPAPR